MGVERVERRLAAIVAVDVAGYSRLMGRDEEGTLAALRAIRRDLSDPEDQGASGPHRQDDGRRAADRIRQRRRRGALFGRGAARDGGTQRKASRPTGASTSASAFTRATSSSRTATFSATGSISPPVSKVSPNRAASASAVWCATKSATSSMSRSTIWASSRSRISPGRCTRFVSAPIPSPASTAAGARHPLPQCGRG